jgi:hypothetical protein
MDYTNLAIAVFTAVAAAAACFSAVASSRSAKESGNFARQQAEALMLAAKANALASRIDFYNKQILEAKEKLRVQFSNSTQPGYAEAQREEKELGLQQVHLVYWLDRQTDALGVGLGVKCPGSPYNERIKSSKGG